MARKTYGYYVEGNTARKLNSQNYTDRLTSRYNRGSAAPVRRQDEIEVPSQPVRRKKGKPLSKRQQRELEKETNRAKYKRVQSESMNLGFVVFLSAMVCILIGLSVNYLNYQADITKAKSNINLLKSNVEVLASQNDAVSYDIDAFIDINRILDVATNELGMVMSNDENIRYFKKNVDEFMNQYADVPEE